MKLGTEVGLGPGHIVLDGDPACSTKWRKTADMKKLRHYHPMYCVKRICKSLCESLSARVPQKPHVQISPRNHLNVCYLVTAQSSSDDNAVRPMFQFCG